MRAESWDVSADAKRIKLNLRKGVQFHSGRELSSDDVKYTFERIRDPKVGVGQFALQGQWFQTVETPDKYTVILTATSRGHWSSTCSRACTSPIDRLWRRPPPPRRQTAPVSCP